MTTIEQTRRSRRLRKKLEAIRRELDAAIALTESPEEPSREQELAKLWGPILEEHAEQIRTSGAITLAESNAIRARYYEAAGLDRRNSAVMFQGPHREGVLIRKVEHGTPRSPEQEVALTTKGERLLAMYRNKP